MASSTSKCRGCLNKANSFCYVCEDFTTVAQRRTITYLLRTAYFHYFDCKIGDQDNSWAPHICCKPCYNGTSGNEPHWITQENLNDPTRDLYLSKQQSELLASRLKQCNLVQEDARITSFRNRNKDLASFFDMENKFCNCTNIPGLFTSLGLPHNPSDWRLFRDSSKRSLKGVLHNRNIPAFPLHTLSI